MPSPQARVWQTWLQRRIQLAVSTAVAEEYAEVLDRLGIERGRVENFSRRLAGETVTRVNLGRRLRLGRDPEDQIILSTADAAKVDYLVTLDRGLLELTIEERRRLKFQIVTPSEFLKIVE
ncbi:MAG: putative toxin-antitoxin system toxin component, PIN family [Chloroflexi bacterium]|nr:putative toxin-antitoxin system toxin component, PIN family [Chloroflexota bacterium]